MQSADNAGGHGLAHACGKADGKDKIANLELAGIGKRNGRQVLCFHLDDGEVEVGIGASALRLQLASIGEGHGNLLGVLDDVIVGDDETLTCVIDNAGAGATYLTRFAIFGAGLWRDVAADLDADHRRRELLEKGSDLERCLARKSAGIRRNAPR
jgi:hypothetical protein